MTGSRYPTTALDRRGVLLGGGALAASLAGCATCPVELPGATQPVAAIADAHVHLFNASDLPVVNFVKFVIIPRHLGQLGDTAQAVVDLVLATLKLFSISARRELNRMPSFGGLPQGDQPSPAEFGKAVADRIQEVRADPAAAEGLVKSYLELTVLVAASAAPEVLAVSTEGAALTEEQVLSRNVLQSVYTAFAARVEAGQALAPADRSAIATLITLTAADPDYVLHLLGWVVLMLKPRCYHLHVYMKRFMAGGDAQPRLLVNHLVDYDAWLGEGPGAGSGHEDQINLWQAYRGRYKDQIDLHTFAGACPLKQAYDVGRGAAVTHFDRLKKAWGDGRIQGFKLYPPMGFRPIGNAGEGDDFWRSPDGLQSRVIDRWNAQNFGKRLGLALDECLRDFYGWCSDPARDVPIMAHAGSGNGAGHGWGQRANPKYWRDVVTEFGALRLDLGHFCEDAQTFVKAVAGYHDDEWALDGTKDLIQDQGGRQSTVFADLGYMAELLSDDVAEPDLTFSFFMALREYCRRYDPDFSQIMFGSDWIMLGQERNNESYLPIMRNGFRRAMQQAEFPPNAMDRVFRDNARRFLKLA